MAANISKQLVTLTTTDNFLTAAVAALTVPGGTTVFKSMTFETVGAALPNNPAVPTSKSQQYLIVSLWADS